MTATLNRQTFSMDRSLEFFSEKELSMQIGCSKDSWSISVVKELIENQTDVISLYKKYTEDELKETLNKFITNMSDQSDEKTQENTSPGTSYSGKPKSDINSKLEALFK